MVAKKSSCAQSITLLVTWINLNYPLSKHLNKFMVVATFKFYYTQEDVCLVYLQSMEKKWCSVQKPG